MKSLIELKEFFAKVEYCPTMPSQYNKFCELIETDELMAWQTVFGSIELLNRYEAKLNRDEVYELAKGVGLMWYENGNLWAEYNVNEGIFHGDRKVWNNNGELIEHSIWKNGELVESKYGAIKYPMEIS